MLQQDTILYDAYSKYYYSTQSYGGCCRPPVFSGALVVAGGLVVI